MASTKLSRKQINMQVILKHEPGAKVPIRKPDMIKEKQIEKGKVGGGTRLKVGDMALR